LLLVRAARRAGKLVRIEVSGHAGFAAAGSDIVCAAVSALVMTAAHGVARVCGASVRVSDDPSGAFVLDVPGGGGADAQAVLETTLAGLQAIARTYPAHVRVLVQRAATRATGARRRSAEKSGPRKGA
jgi:uncharacterized protein YsxB (DUF464 family)